MEVKGTRDGAVEAAGAFCVWASERGRVLVTAGVSERD